MGVDLTGNWLMTILPDTRYQFNSNSIELVKLKTDNVIGAIPGMWQFEWPYFKVDNLLLKLKSDCSK